MNEQKKKKKKKKKKKLIINIVKINIIRVNQLFSQLQMVVLRLYVNK